MFAVVNSMDYIPLGKELDLANMTMFAIDRSKILGDVELINHHSMLQSVILYGMIVTRVGMLDIEYSFGT